MFPLMMTMIVSDCVNRVCLVWDKHVGVSHYWQVFFNPFMPETHLEILLCLTPDDFTRQRETPWASKS